MKSTIFIESILSERNRSGQGVQRDLTSDDIPTEILSLLEKQKAIK